MEKVRVVVATRENRADFIHKTATGRSLARLPHPAIDTQIVLDNQRGLPEIYNAIVEHHRNDPSYFVFMHDDIHILDFFWIDHIIEGLQQFQILGLAGSKVRQPNQTIWAPDGVLKMGMREDLSGAVGHGQAFEPDQVTFFGPAKQQVKLLDGLMLCTHSSTMINNQLFFDQRFDFHFYDMDFCRQAEEKNISCGTWGISVVHQSSGNFNSPAWQSARDKYLDKWGS